MIVFSLTEAPLPDPTPTPSNTPKRTLNGPEMDPKRTQTDPNEPEKDRNRPEMDRIKRGCKGKRKSLPQSVRAATFTMPDLSENPGLPLEPGFGAYQGWAQKIKVAFLGIGCFLFSFFFFAVLRSRKQNKTRAKPRYTPNSG